MKEYFDFNQYSQGRKKFYDKLADFKIDYDNISQPIILDHIFFNKVNLEFKPFFERRKQKGRLSRIESENYKSQFNNLNAQLIDIYYYKGPAIYWFKITHAENSSNQKLLKKFSSARTNKPGWWSKAGRDIESKTEYLYVGKVEKNLHDRLIQHIGLGHVMTSSLKLTHWFHSFEKTQLSFQYLKIEPEFIPYLEDIENVIWRQLNPLIGAEPRIKS